ncbi:unnamed protein product, partial [Effrenium voratum]
VVSAGCGRCSRQWKTCWLRSMASSTSSYSSSEPGDAPMGAGPVAPAVLGEDTAGEEADAAGLAAVPEAGVTAPANSEKREDLL